MIYAQFMYTNVKIDIFEKEFFFNKKMWLSAVLSFKEVGLPTPLTIRSILSFQKRFFLSINYYLVKENSINFNFKVSMFSSISSCRALLLKEIYKVEEWPRPSSPLNLFKRVWQTGIEKEFCLPRLQNIFLLFDQNFNKYENE